MKKIVLVLILLLIVAIATHQWMMGGSWFGMPYHHMSGWSNQARSTNASSDIGGIGDLKQLGEQVFNRHCIVCHGKKGQGLVADWQRKQSDGSYPPPPLNGTAHTWHHSPKALLKTISDGTMALGGNMPAFDQRLSDVEKNALLHYLYSLWPEKIQKMWRQRFGNQTSDFQ